MTTKGNTKLKEQSNLSCYKICYNRTVTFNSASSMKHFTFVNWNSNLSNDSNPNLESSVTVNHRTKSIRFQKQSWQRSWNYRYWSCTHSLQSPSCCFKINIHHYKCLKYSYYHDGQHNERWGTDKSQSDSNCCIHSENKLPVLFFHKQPTLQNTKSVLHFKSKY